MNKLILTIAALFVISTSTSDACMTKPAKPGTKSKAATNFKRSSRNPASLPKFADGHPSPSLETKLANLLLEHKPKNPSDKVVLSIPAVIEIPERIKDKKIENYRPFGDAQVNAEMGFGPYWKDSSFPAIGIQFTSANGVKERKYQFAASMNVKDYTEKKLESGWYQVQPKGWENSFYFNFEPDTLPIPKFLEGVPEKFRMFSGRLAPNPAKVPRSIGAVKIEEMDLGAGYNTDSWNDISVHGIYPHPDHKPHKTAIGGVKTWGITDGPHEGSFSHLYTCFETRNPAGEKEHGVPSGAGWHYIGADGESILNSLEELPLPVAIGRTHGFSKSAYELPETITATWLMTDEVLITLNKAFHWYVNPYDSDVCTEIWIHNCKPDLSNSWGFGCPWIKK